MIGSQFIKAPGNMFAARRTISDHGFDPDAQQATLTVARSMTGSPDWDQMVTGFEVLWALASLNNPAAAHFYVRAIDRYIADNTLEALEAQHFADVAANWRGLIALEPVNFSKMPPRGPDHGDPVDREDPADPWIATKAEGFVVLREIGDPLSKEGQEFVARFKAILDKPLPRRGFTPALGALESAILMKYPWATAAAAKLETGFRIIRETGAERARLKPILLVGDPGTGKTSLLLDVARMLGRHGMRIAAGGARDGATLDALARGWSTARASAPAQAMLASGSCDPCILVDELDKAGGLSSPNGSVGGTLMGMLDRPDAFYDTALMANVDLTQVLFTATANELSNIAPELRDRFDIVHVPRPKEEHFPIILRELRRNQANALGVDERLIPELDGDEYRALRSHFLDKGRSLRQLDSAFRFVLEEAFKRQASHSQTSRLM